MQAKKTENVQVLTDLREVNKLIEYKPFLLLHINDLIQKMQKFKSATALDLSQGYYIVPIDKESSPICTIILPWDNYAYKRLPMGLCLAPDIFQNLMLQYLGYLDYILVYIDDVIPAVLAVLILRMMIIYFNARPDLDFSGSSIRN